MPEGKIKWFDKKKGYGFIKEDKTDRDIFLHVTELENSRLKVLKEEQKLKFDIKLILIGLFLILFTRLYLYFSIISVGIWNNDKMLVI